LSQTDNSVPPLHDVHNPQTILRGLQLNFSGVIVIEKVTEL